MYRKLQLFKLRRCSPSLLHIGQYLLLALEPEKALLCIARVCCNMSSTKTRRLIRKCSLSLCLRTKQVEQDPQNNCQALSNPQTFCEIRRLITMRTTASKWKISPAKLKHSAHIIFKTRFNKSSLLCLGPPGGFLPSDLPTKSLYGFLISPNYHRPIHVIVLQFVTWMTSGTDNTLRSTSCR